MRKVYLILLAISIISACTSTTDVTATQIPPLSPTDAPPASMPTLEADPVLPTLTKSIELSTVPAPKDDFFTEMGIAIPAPTCSALTQAQTEGPYYIPNTPEKHSLLEGA